MFSESGVFIPDERERRIITSDEFYFGEPTDLTNTRKALQELLQDPDTSMQDIVEIFSPRTTQDLLNQRTKKDIQTFRALIDKHVSSILEKEMKDLSDADIEALLRAEVVPGYLLAQYANMQYHAGALHVAEQWGSILSESRAISETVRANQYNLLGTVADKRGDKAISKKWNTEGLELLEGDSDPNILWQRLKIEHGLALGDIDALERILEARIVLGDVAHVGRTHLDIARAWAQTERDAAVYHYRMAYEGLVGAGYLAKANDAEVELDALINTESNLFVVPELKGTSEIRFEGMQQPASCLVRHGDSYIVSYDHGSELFQPVTVDQKRTNGAEKEVRSAIARILNQLHPVLDPEAVVRMKDGITLSQRKTKVVPADVKREELKDGRKHFYYTVGLELEHELFEFLEGLPLDKQQEIGYVLLSVDELRELEATDPDLDILRKNELAFLERKNMRGE